MKAFAISIIITLLTTSFNIAQTTNDPDPSWAKWKFLIGEWAWELNGQPGIQSTTFSFEPDLNKQIITGEIHVERSDTGSRLGHGGRKDLLIVYRNAAGKLDKAIYFDNDGRVINYSVSLKDDSSIVFTSPGYRITYHRSANDIIKITSESSSADKPDAFALVNEGKWIRIK